MFYPTGLAVERYRAPKSLHYDGDVASAVAAIEAGQDRVWMPARLVRAAVNRPLDAPNRLEAIQLATAMALDVYQGEITAALHRSPQLLEHIGNVAIRQGWDPNTRDASTPYKTHQVAQRLEARVPGPALLIALCHGGFVAGSLTYLYRHNDHPDDAVYPVRLSTVKEQDDRPFLSDEEISYLRELAPGRTVVVIDEDTARGDTMTTAVRSFSDLLGQPVIGTVCDDYRRPEDVAVQGTFWENV